MLVFEFVFEAAELYSYGLELCSLSSLCELTEIDLPASEVLGPKVKTKNLLFCGMYLVVAWQRK